MTPSRLKFRPTSTRVTSSDITLSSFRAAGPRNHLASSRPTFSAFYQTSLRFWTSRSLNPNRQTPTCQFPLSPSRFTLSDPCVPDLDSVCFPDLHPVETRFQLAISAFTQSGVTFCFPPPDPQFPPPTLPARALLSVPAEHDCHLARMLQQQAPRVLACLRRRPSSAQTSSLPPSLDRVFKYRGQAASVLLVPFVAPRTQVLRSCFQAP
jgi:hypothetical protein